MTIQEREILVSEFASEVLTLVRRMERLGYHDDNIAAVLEEVIKDNLQNFNN